MISVDPMIHVRFQGEQTHWQRSGRTRQANPDLVRRIAKPCKVIARDKRAGYRPIRSGAVERVIIKGSVVTGRCCGCWQVCWMIGQCGPPGGPVGGKVSGSVAASHRHLSNMLVGSFKVHNSRMHWSPAIEAHIQHIVGIGVSECISQMPVRVSVCRGCRQVQAVQWPKRGTCLQEGQQSSEAFRRGTLFENIGRKESRIWFVLELPSVEVDVTRLFGFYVLVSELALLCLEYIHPDKILNNWMKSFPIRSTII